MYWQLQRKASVPTWRKPRNCADARYLAFVWSKRSHWSREKTGLWKEEQANRMLRDFPVRPGSHAWHRAVHEVQKVFPGTESWLLSCSGAEGGHGRWVSYGGGSYYPGFERNYVVGGWMQFKYPTFTGMYRHALDDLKARRILVPPELQQPGVKAWLSALGQALAAAWARYTGNDASHWSASWSNGC